MDSPSQKVTRLISQACNQYPGGLRAVFAAIREQPESAQRSESTFYADFNANASSNGNLKVRDFISAMQVTGDISALRYIASLFGYTLTSLSSVEPDAPTLDAEMLQDYPAVVEFHKAAKEFNATDDGSGLLAKMDAAIVDLRQTAAMALRGKQ